jgi:putative RNA 2'-phosphotransferase
MIYILGHSPHEFGIVPDKNGFVGIKELLQAMHEDPDMPHINEGGINEVLMSDERELFERFDNKLRAVSRHWVLETELPATDIPPILFTPVRRKAHYLVLEKGLIKRDDHFYCLTPDREMAERIGKRKDQKPVIIELMALRAANEGVHISKFGGLYLASEIPVRFIAGPPLPKAALKERETAAQVKKEVIDEIKDFSPGSFFLDLRNDPDKSKRIKGRKKRGWKEEVRGMRRKG